MRSGRFHLFDGRAHGLNDVPDLAEGMDIARPDLARKKKVRRVTYFSLSGASCSCWSRLGLQQVQPSAPRVDRDALYIDTVRRGPMVREVRGRGTLVPEKIRWIPATDGRPPSRGSSSIPGAEVTPDSVIVELINPELEHQARRPS